MDFYQITFSTTARFVCIALESLCSYAQHVLTVTDMGVSSTVTSTSTAPTKKRGFYFTLVIRCFLIKRRCCRELPAKISDLFVYKGYAFNIKPSYPVKAHPFHAILILFISITAKSIHFFPPHLPIFLLTSAFVLLL